MTVGRRRLAPVSSWQVTGFLALLLLGFLIAAQASSQAPRVRYTTQERQPLVETALGLQSQQETLKDRIEALRAQIATLEKEAEGSDAIVRQLNAEAEAARIAAGLTALTGPGIVLQLEDSPEAVGGDDGGGDALVTGEDLRTVVEELWLAGAEAISINGERIVGPTAVVDIGGSLLVNSAYLAPPYQVAAIGPADLYERMSASAGFRDFVAARATAAGIRLSFAEAADLVVPAYAGSVSLRYAAPASSPSPAPGG
ncbi:MAG: DUF881 domain-containing protein [Chloroflexi bacterium]|nr:DUF881 domain-containing protein [Chloroflexota bacterium]